MFPHIQFYLKNTFRHHLAESRLHGIAIAARAFTIQGRMHNSGIRFRRSGCINGDRFQLSPNHIQPPGQFSLPQFQSVVQLKGFFGDVIHALWIRLYFGPILCDHQFRCDVCLQLIVNPVGIFSRRHPEYD